MKTKGLLMTNGIVGLIGGVLLVLGPFLITGGAVSDIANGTANTGGVSVLLNLLKIAALALGIIGLVYYKGDERVKPAANILLVVGGGVALIPFLGWAGGIVVIVGGALGLAGLKRFAPEEENKP